GVLACPDAACEVLGDGDALDADVGADTSGVEVYAAALPLDDNTIADGDVSSCAGGEDARTGADIDRLEAKAHHVDADIAGRDEDAALLRLAEEVAGEVVRPRLGDAEGVVGIT